MVKNIIINNVLNIYLNNIIKHIMEKNIFKVIKI